MKRITLSLLVTFSLSYSHFISAGGIETNASTPYWTGFYLGVNGGYWWSQTNEIATSSSASFINPTFVTGANNIANALVQVGTNKFSLQSNGFIGGAQFGYNYQCNRFVLGLNADLNGLTNSHNSYHLQKTVNLFNFDESYTGSLAIKQRMNDLGSLRARLGYLYQPSLLLYATGGFAYSNVTLNTAWRAQESLGSTVFPPVMTQNNSSRTLTGWTVGGGIEWVFNPSWSAMLEYDYYSLNKINASVTLSQMNGALSPPMLWGSTTTKTVLSLSFGAMRVGLNYHFC